MAKEKPSWHTNWARAENALMNYHRLRVGLVHLVNRPFLKPWQYEIAAKELTPAEEEQMANERAASGRYRGLSFNSIPQHPELTKSQQLDAYTLWADPFQCEEIMGGEAWKAAEYRFCPYYAPPTVKPWAWIGSWEMITRLMKPWSRDKDEAEFARMKRIYQAGYEIAIDKLAREKFAA